MLQSNFVIKSKVFRQLSGFDENLESSCDRDIFLRALILNNNYYHIKLRLVNYQIHDKNWSTDKGFNIIFSKLAFYIKHFKYYHFLDHYQFFKFVMKLFFIEIKKILIKKKIKH